MKSLSLKNNHSVAMNIKSVLQVVAIRRDTPSDVKFSTTSHALFRVGDELQIKINSQWYQVRITKRLENEDTIDFGAVKL